MSLASLPTPPANQQAGWGDTRRKDPPPNCEEALRLDPKCALAHTYLGWAHHNQGDLDKALTDLSEAIRLDPKLALAYQWRAAAYRVMGDLDKAKSDERKAQELDR